MRSCTSFQTQGVALVLSPKVRQGYFVGLDYGHESKNNGEGYVVQIQVTAGYKDHRIVSTVTFRYLYFVERHTSTMKALVSCFQ